MGGVASSAGTRPREPRGHQSTLSRPVSTHGLSLPVRGEVRLAQAYGEPQAR
ncbi:hypothetical protein P405_10530 [Streptomyces sp. FR-008]|nr:hypothetical protein P405_10530 [Streptomyces sp. FR-008]